MPEITIVIPAYREDESIRGVVEETRRVMDETGRSYELLVVDDGSDDGTAEEARRGGARVLSHPYNIGNGAAVKLSLIHL
jgi:glycosyltransferase involved in cell wall biosynthesis